MLGRVCGIAILFAEVGVADAQPAGPIDHDEHERVELRYTAPGECPTRDAVVALVRERTPAVEVATGAPRVFAITITASADGFAGSLVVDGSADKQLTATRCDDLVSALALVTALAIDPLASTAPISITHTAPPPGHSPSA